jgi:glycosyltransferase involved in cell wall biosynthesis
MITQAVDEDDPVLGFTPGWVNALAEHLGRLSVLCLRAGRHTRQENVTLRVLGEGKLRRLCRLRRGLKDELKGMERGVVFAHMCPRYAVAARRIVGKHVPILLWYAHSARSFWLRRAYRVSRVVLTPTAESCPIESEKVRVVGHGIDTRKFSPASRTEDGRTVLLSAGRITRVKRYEFLIEAVAQAAKSFDRGELHLRILGSTCLAEDERYFSELKALARAKGFDQMIEFRAAVPYSRIEEEYADCDLFLNTAIRHSIDKAPLEAMACGRVLLTANRNFRQVLGEHARILVANDENPDDLARKIVQVARMTASEREKLGLALREIVVRDHGLDRLMKHVAETITELQRE